jgi:glycosyltransferase involved in cell wall biosynthesis
MQQFEVFVFSSYLEGLGTAVLDAMALHKPVVATAAGGIPEVVQDGVTGVLVPPRDPQALAQAVYQLLRHPEQRRRFGEAGRQRVEQYFTAQQMAAHTLQLYRRLLPHAP